MDRSGIVRHRSGGRDGVRRFAGDRPTEAPSRGESPFYIKSLTDEQFGVLVTFHDAHGFWAGQESCKVEVSLTWDETLTEVEEISLTCAHHGESVTSDRLGNTCRTSYVCEGGETA